MPQPTPQSRDHGLDNLRVFVIFLVVLLHASLTYMAYAPSWWYVLDPVRNLFFTKVVLVIDVPIMLIMFFLAGYFAYPSLSKRGPAAFFKDKTIRIGIPWVFGSLVLAPPTAYMIYYSRHLPISLATFWATDFWGKAFQQSVYWYLGVLFLFFGLTALTYANSKRFAGWQARAERPAWWLLALFVLVLTAASLVISLTGSFDKWSHIYVLVYQPTRVPLYIGYFALGIYASQRRWFTRQGYLPNLGLWLALCVVSGFVYLSWRLSPPILTGTFGTKVVTAVLFNVFCFASLLAGVGLFQTYAGSASPAWRSQARNSYGVYYLHPLVLYPLALLFVPFPISIYLKAAAITLLSYLICWALGAALLTRLPGLRRMF